MSDVVAQWWTCYICKYSVSHPFTVCLFYNMIVNTHGFTLYLNLSLAHVLSVLRNYIQNTQSLDAVLFFKSSWRCCPASPLVLIIWHQKRTWFFTLNRLLQILQPLSIKWPSLPSLQWKYSTDLRTAEVGTIYTSGLNWKTTVSSTWSPKNLLNLRKCVVVECHRIVWLN